MGLLEDILEQLREVRTDLAALRAHEPVHPDHEGFIDIDEAGAIMKLGRDAMRRRCQRRIIPFYQEQVGGPQLFRRSELLAYVQGKRKATATEDSQKTLKKVHDCRK